MSALIKTDLVACWLSSVAVLPEMFTGGMVVEGLMNPWPEVGRPNDVDWLALSVGHLIYKGRDRQFIINEASGVETKTSLSKFRRSDHFV